MDNFDDIASAAWEEAKTPLEKMYDTWVGDQPGPDPDQVKFIIYSELTGLPYLCCICGHGDQWTVEGDEVRQIARVFICEHEPIMAAGGKGIRQLNSVPVNKVGRFERMESGTVD